MISADVLSDSARFAGRHFRAPDVVEQRGLAVVDMAHDGDHRGTQLADGFLGLLGRRALQVLLDLVFLQDLGGVPHLLDHQHRGVLIDRLVDGRHDAHVHQHLDDLGRLDCHLLRELGNGNRLADAHFTHDRSRRHLEAMASIGRTGDRPRLGAALLLIT